MSEGQDIRLTALDQFRGYTVVGMLIVNFVGKYENMPTTLDHHHTYCSFADTIMPQFLFAVGLAMRMTFLKRLTKDGAGPTHRKFIWRSLALILVGCVVYRLTGEWKSWQQFQSQNWSTFFAHLFKRGPFETLTHIGVTTLYVLPVIAARPTIRVGYLVLSAIIHAGISLTWYYQWNLSDPRGIDGGPLGFFSWAIPLLVGTLAFDALGRFKPIYMVTVGLFLCGFAIGLMTMLNHSAWFPFANWPRGASNPHLDYWTMSQRAGSITYTIFGSGFALIIFALMLRFERYLQLGLFALFGTHALATYLIHDVVSGMVKPFVPRDAPAWYVWSGFAVYFLVTWLMVKYLDRNRLFLRL